MASPCRLQPGELVAYRDNLLPVGRREIVEAHLAACHHCQKRLATFNEVDSIIQEKAVAVEFSAQRRDALRIQLQQQSDSRVGLSRHPRLISLPQSLVARSLIALLVVLLALPPATEAGFPLKRFVHFAEVEIKQRLPFDKQEVIRHVAPSDPNISAPSFNTVAPAGLPLGLVRVEQSAPEPELLELLYRNDADVALLVTQLPADKGMVTLEVTATEVTKVQGAEVLVLRDSRPDAVAALTWERNGVFFDVMVIEAPTGKYGGFKRADALLVVEALITAQDDARE